MFCTGDRASSDSLSWVPYSNVFIVHRIRNVIMRGGKQSKFSAITAVSITGNNAQASPGSSRHQTREHHVQSLSQKNGLY